MPGCVTHCVLPAAWERMQTSASEGLPVWPWSPLHPHLPFAPQPPALHPHQFPPQGLQALAMEHRFPAMQYMSRRHRKESPLLTLWVLLYFQVVCTTLCSPLIFHVSYRTSAMPPIRLCAPKDRITSLSFAVAFPAPKSSCQFNTCSQSE